MPFAKIEGLIRLSEDTELGDFGGSTIVIPEGQYFLNSPGDGDRSLLDEIVFQVDAALGAGTSCTLDDDTDAATGRLTIARAGAFAVTWTSTPLRHLLGYTGDLASAASHLAPMHPTYLWLPDCGRAGLLAPESTSNTQYGKPETDASVSLAPSGAAARHAYHRRYFENLEWRHVTANRVWREHEVVAQESLEQFYEDVIGIGRAFRLHPDRSDDAVYQGYWAEDFGGFNARWLIESWVGSKAKCVVQYLCRKDMTDYVDGGILA